MRSNETITEAENKTYDAFCLKNRIANDGTPGAIKNGEAIVDYIVTRWREDINDYTLGVALEKLRPGLSFISKEQAEVAEVLATLSQAERDNVAAWLNRQHRLVVEGDQGYSNVSTLVSWIKAHNFEVNAHNLNNAIGNCQNSSHRKLFWQEAPKQDRAIPNHINHALTDKDARFMPKTETNRTWRDIVNSNRAKPEAPVEAIHEDFQVKAEAVQGRTHSQTDQARRIVVTVPGTRTIDWEATYSARLRFISKQQPAFVRR
jgi:hypothetical protein